MVKYRNIANLDKNKISIKTKWKIRVNLSLINSVFNQTPTIKMDTNRSTVDNLLDKLEILLKKQEQFSQEIQELKREISKVITEPKSETPDISFSDSDMVVESTEELEKVSIQDQTEPILAKPESHFINKPPSSVSLDVKSNLEKFIGENLINKIGIVITIIGVAIGARYAIENQFISPLTRIILGYLFGLGLFGVAIKLKKEYTNFSAVLLSGSLSIMYFITFFAFNFYNLFPQGITFGIMLLLTGFTVLAAYNYNQQVIAHIGLVGAYAIPFLLSNSSGRIEVLFSYIAIINIGILAISLKKYWKSVYYSSFIATWIIYLIWLVVKFKPADQQFLALGFATAFFVIFYLTFLLFKIVQKEKFVFSDILLLLSNSFIFYFIGYSILSDHSDFSKYLGTFTIFNAIIHSLVSAIVYKQKLADRNLFYFVLGLVFVFITITIPVQLDGNWVTILWATEAAVLFWIGRTRGVDFYEKLSLPLMGLALFSIIHDWNSVYGEINQGITTLTLTPIFNLTFLTSVITVAAFSFINVVNFNKKYSLPKFQNDGTQILVSSFIVATILITSYFSIALEISNYWNQLYFNSAIEIVGENNLSTQILNNNLPHFKTVWIINFSLLFCTALTLLVDLKIKSILSSKLVLSLNFLVIFALLSIGLYTFSVLRINYLEKINADYFNIGIINIWIRYISFAFTSVLVIASYKLIRKTSLPISFYNAIDIMLHFSIIWILSSELIHWMDIAKSAQSYKLGLSILWGSYSLLLIIIGLWKKKKHLRIGAITLFGVTLAKLFLYDIAHLETIPKTIVLVSLGLLLLIISFLYNKYKHLVT
jgi:LysM repeat protein